jgi:hypothetical protein
VPKGSKILITERTPADRVNNPGGALCLSHLAHGHENRLDDVLFLLDTWSSELVVLGLHEHCGFMASAGIHMDVALEAAKDVAKRIRSLRPRAGVIIVHDTLEPGLDRFQVQATFFPTSWGTAIPLPSHNPPRTSVGSD